METGTAEYCPRCNGCGYVAGRGRAEQPWRNFQDLPLSATLEKIFGVHAPRSCPDCEGSGARPAATAQVQGKSHASFLEQPSVFS